MYTHPSGMVFVGGPKLLVLNKETSQALFQTDKAIIGGAGSASDLGTTWGWMSSGLEGRTPRVRNIELVALTREGIYTTINNLGNWIGVNAELYAIGSGMEYAMGALGAGKSPRKAIEIASVYDNATGFDITEYRL